MTLHQHNWRNFKEKLYDEVLQGDPRQVLVLTICQEPRQRHYKKTASKKAKHANQMAQKRYDQKQGVAAIKLLAKADNKRNHTTTEQ